MPKKIDLTNKKFGKLTVIREATKEEKFNKPGAYWICNCDCGTKNIVKNGQGLRKGETTSCGCDLHEKLIKRPRKNFIDETGNKYGRLTVLYRDYKEEEKHSTRGSTYWKCKCDCGQEISVLRSSLINGSTKSCGCFRKEKSAEHLTQFSKNNFINEIGNKYGKLTVIEKVENNKAGSVHWKCLCECGNIKIISGSSLRSGNTSSCGCIGKSKGEFFIEKLLNENNILFIREYPIIINNKRLRYDFAILENNSVKYLIEFDGEQHFKEIEYFGGKQQLDKTKKNDEIKNQWAKKNNIPLIRIPYTHLKDLCIEDLQLETTKWRVV